LIDPTPSGRVFIFDTRANSYAGYIDVKNPSPISYQTDRIVITPDGKTAYVSNWLDRIFVIDLQRKEVVKMIPVPHGAQPVPMVLGTRP
jgi:DNA-binding beta-propeller fold protein YncE